MRFVISPAGGSSGESPSRVLPLSSRTVIRHFILGCAVLAMLLQPALGADRAALVIGCGKYRAEGVPELSTPVNDAHKMAAALRRAPLNFDVVEAADATRNQFFEKLDEF